MTQGVTATAEVFLSLQDLHTLWEAVREESEKRRSWVKKLDLTFTEYESERTAMVRPCVCVCAYECVCDVINRYIGCVLYVFLLDN